MRELVWIAGHIEHRNSERKLQVWACLKPTPIWGSLLHLSKQFFCFEFNECVALPSVTHSRYNWMFQIHTLYRVCGLTIFFFKFCRSYSRACGWPLFWPQIRREHSLNLSILLSEGKENNNDSLSNGEWTGKSSVLNLSAFGVEWNVTYMFYIGRSVQV